MVEYLFSYAWRTEAKDSGKVLGFRRVSAGEMETHASRWSHVEEHVLHNIFFAQRLKTNSKKTYFSRGKFSNKQIIIIIIIITT